ncbi:MAG: glycoside hydrolase family 38 C-terminal domain-containing protein [Bacteroidales bacterium]
MKEINLIFLLLFMVAAFGQNKQSNPKSVNQNVVRREVAEAYLPFPSDIECVPQPVYRRRADGKPGREITLNLKGEKLLSKAQVYVTVDGLTEITEVSPMVNGRSVCRILLPANVGVKQESKVSLTLRQGTKELKQTITVTALRHWTVYVYPHSHVDIGYTNTQANVEILHKRNIDEGIKLAEATKDYPAGARYRWNPEVTWPLERYWHTATPEQKECVVKAIQSGYLCIDAGYLNLNTSSCSDEELFQVFRFSREMQKLTGVPMNTFQQMDIPGMSWGLVPVMAQQGVRYIMSWPNSCRAGNGRSLDEKPFWWVGPDGKSKILFFQPGGYANSGSMSKGGAIGRPWFGQRDPDKVPSVIKTGSADVNFLGALSAREHPQNPYDFYVVSWSLWDNTPLDADLPGAVKAWNDEYAYPHLVIAGAQEIMQMIETKYGDKLPTVKGDFTEYWTDGLGTAARLTAINRNAKERLVQAETLWTMLHPGQPAPQAEFNEAWRYIALGTEHTWCAENPTEPFFQDAIWKVKQSYFREADDRTQTLFDNALAPATDKSSGALGPADGPANGGVSVFNTQSWSHGGLVTLSKAESLRGDRVTDDRGDDVPAQRLSTGELAFLASDVPAFGSRHYRVVAGKCPLTNGCRLDGTTLGNQQVRVTIDPATGNITHLVNLTTGRNFVDAKVNGGLNAFRWMPGDSDNARPDTVISISTVESGPLVVELRVASKATGCRTVTRSVRLVYGQLWVDIANVVDKLPLPAKDGIHFGFGFDIPQATTRVDIPWGVMRVEDDQWAAGNRNWLTMQRWLDISNDKVGITWCSLDAALFEYGGMTANQTGSWSGERKPWLKKLEPSSAIYSWVMNNHWFTNFPLTQDGPVTFRYRILPHGPYNAATANRFGLEQAQPLVHVAANSNAISKPMVGLEGSPAITVSVLKSTEEGKTVIMRLRSVSDKDEKIKLLWPAENPRSLNICDVEEVSGRKVNNEVTVPANGFVTLKAIY